MLYKNQRGIGLILEIIVVAIVITAIGIIGFKAHQIKIHSKSQLAPSSDAKRYLSIKEWGVRMAADSDGDFSLAGPPKAPVYSDKDQGVTIKSQKLAKIWRCQVDDNGDYKGSIGTVTRTTESERSGPYQPAASKKLGQYTYNLDLTQNICTSDEKAETAARDQLKTIFSSLEVSADQTANWKTYNSANEPLSFKYPNDWKMKPTPPSPDGMSGDSVELTSPSGFTLKYDSSAGGFGGGCGPCPDVDTYRLMPVPSANAATPIFIAEGSVKGNDKSDTQNYNQYIPTIGLIGKTDLADVPKIGQVSQSFPYYFIFPKKNTKTVGYVMFEFTAYPNQNSDMSKWHYTKNNIQDFFNQPDIQTARLILQSLKY